MEKLKNLRCEYKGEREFRFIWDTTQINGVSKVILFELGSEHLNYIPDGAIHSTEFYKGELTMNTISEDSEHRFIVIGAGTEAQYDRDAIVRWCNQQGLNTLIVKGVSLEGILYYEYSQSSSMSPGSLAVGSAYHEADGLVNLTVELHPRYGLVIPAGYIYFTYRYLLQDFVFLIPQQIEGENVQLHLRVPKEYEDFRIIQNGSRIEVTDQKEEEPAGCFFGRFFQRLRGKNKGESK